MIIHSKFKDYIVSIEKDLDFLLQLSHEKSAGFVIDRMVYDLYKTYFEGIPKENLYLIEALEENKTINSVLEICDMMASMPAKRNAHLISIGG